MYELIDETKASHFHWLYVEQLSYYTGLVTSCYFKWVSYKPELFNYDCACYEFKWRRVSSICYLFLCMLVIPGCCRQP